MSTVEDFKNAPVGATATHAGGSRVMKIDDGEQRWVTRGGICLSDEQVERRGYALDLPTTVRDALELAWELAHEVKPGQVIPAGTRYLQDQGSGLNESRARCDFNISPGIAPHIRTLKPLPDPEPSWIDAPAVLARLGEWGRDGREVFVPAGEEENSWVAMFSAQSYHWDKLIDVTPLYPKEA